MTKNEPFFSFCFLHRHFRFVRLQSCLNLYIIHLYIPKLLQKLGSKEPPSPFIIDFTGNISKNKRGNAANKFAQNPISWAHKVYDRKCIMTLRILYIKFRWSSCEHFSKSQFWGENVHEIRLASTYLILWGGLFSSIRKVY
jgi:hypothetical protein